MDCPAVDFITAPREFPAAAVLRTTAHTCTPRTAPSPIQARVRLQSGILPRCAAPSHSTESRSCRNGSVLLPPAPCPAQLCLHPSPASSGHCAGTLPVQAARCQLGQGRVSPASAPSTHVKRSGFRSYMPPPPNLFSFLGADRWTDRTGLQQHLKTKWSGGKGGVIKNDS